MDLKNKSEQNQSEHSPEKVETVFNKSDHVSDNKSSDVKPSNVEIKPNHVHKDHVKKSVHHNTHHKVKKNKFNHWQIATGLLTLLLIASVFTNGFSSSSSSADSLSSEEIEQKALEYLNTQVLQGQGTAEVLSITENEDLYELEINVQGQTITSYATKDGSLLFPSALNMDEELSDSAGSASSAPVAEVATKSDKPEVELFIMSHCPYGTQIEKGMLPVALLLGDKIDFEIKFVYYAMHGETEVLEQLNQYCIQEEQNDLFFDYMTCFLEAGDGEGCLESTGVDMDTLESCAEVADEVFSITANLDDTASYLSGKFPMFNIHKTENDNYGVRGSPTLVINGEQVSAGRDSISLLSAVCGAFNEAPEECDTELEVGTPGPGFGWDSSGSANVAACGG